MPHYGYRVDLKSAQCGFESHWGHRSGVVPDASATALAIPYSNLP